ncbi:MAG: chorismate mutase [bacterium]
MNTEGIDTLRNIIDTIDGTIIHALGMRMKVVKKIGEIKKTSRIAPLDVARWDTVLESRKKSAQQEGLDEKMVERIYQVIHEYSLAIQEK